MPSKKIEETIEVIELPEHIKCGATYAIAQANPNYLTHSYFKYPCKFIPELPKWGMKKYIKNKEAIVFDPFSGSGTTLLEAVINGYEALGTEIDDIAKLLIKVKTTPLKAEEITVAEEWVNRILENLDNTDIKPKVAKIDNLDHWFPQNAILRMGRLISQIESIENEKISNFLKVCFASIVKKCSFADDVSPKPYVSTKIIKEPADVEKEFSSTTSKYIKLMKEFSEIGVRGNTRIIKGDALKIKEKIKVDFVMTSPPYINAFDYGRTLRLENLWLDFLTEKELRDKKAFYVGTEKIKTKEEEILHILEKSELLKGYYNTIQQVDNKRGLIVKKFFEDMEVNLKEVHRVLNDNGVYCIVIGNSTIRKVEIESWKVIRDIAIKNGFTELENFSYIIRNPYIRIPRAGKGGEINKDYVLVLQKKGVKEDDTKK